MDGHSDGLYCLARNPQSLTSLLSGAADGELRLWDLPSRRTLRRLLGHTRAGAPPHPRRHSSPSHPSSPLKGKGSQPSRRGRVIERPSPPPLAVRGVAVAADGLYAVSASDDCSVRLWQLPAAAAGEMFAAADAPPTEQAADGVACSECGRRIAVAEAGTHADWHFARSLQREERGGGVKATPVQQKVARRGTPAKGPMDAFLRR